MNSRHEFIHYAVKWRVFTPNAVTARSNLAWLKMTMDQLVDDLQSEAAQYVACGAWNDDEARQYVANHQAEYDRYFQSTFSAMQKRHGSGFQITPPPVISQAV